MKYVITILIVILLHLQYKLWLSDGGVPEMLKLRHEMSELTEEVNGLRERNRELAAEVADLKKGLDAIEERARSELGMVGKDETFFLVINPGATMPPKPTEVPPDE